MRNSHSLSCFLSLNSPRVFTYCHSVLKTWSTCCRISKTGWGYMWLWLLLHVSESFNLSVTFIPLETLCHLSKLDVCICASFPITSLPWDRAHEKWENCGIWNTAPLHRHYRSESHDLKGTAPVWYLFSSSLFKMEGILMLHMLMVENNSIHTHKLRVLSVRCTSRCRETCENINILHNDANVMQQLLQKSYSSITPGKVFITMLNVKFTCAIGFSHNLSWKQ